MGSLGDEILTAHLSTRNPQKPTEIANMVMKNVSRAAVVTGVFLFSCFRVTDITLA
jgi:hypothetical protein